MVSVVGPGAKLDLAPYTFFTHSTGNAAIDADLEYIWNLPWSETAIGPISTWPAELLALINLAILSPQPQLFLLGPDSIILYNTAYGQLLYDHHPLYQGRPIGLNQALIAQAPAINRIVDRATGKTQPANENSVPFFFLNNGRLEEVFLSATMIKLPQALGGFHATTYDTTSQAVQARRNYALEQISSHASQAKCLPNLWSSICEGIVSADMDIPSLVLYCADTKLVRDSQTGATHRWIDTDRFFFTGKVGRFQTSLPAEISLSADEDWISVLRDTVTSREPAMLDAKRGTLPESFCSDSPDRCYGDLCREAIVIPSSLDAGADIHGFLIIGLAPRRPYDHEYRDWIRTLNRTIANLVASITITENRTLTRENETIRAAKERDILAKELSLQKQEVMLTTGKMHRMLDIIQSVNVGVFECLASGQLTQTNDSFYRLTGTQHGLDGGIQHNILELCHPEDATTMAQHLQLLASGKQSTFTIRFLPKEGFDNDSTTWVQLACVPVFNDMSMMECITGCVTDITAQKILEQEAIKRAEALEQLRLSELRMLQEAIEAKRQQERFVDMTSHEIRNPLGVVVHSVDALAQILIDMKSILDGPKVLTKTAQVDRLRALLQESSELVDTIMLCTTHQKRITDDILSLSKLDAELLEICPVPFELARFVDQIRGTFLSEATRGEVALKITRDPSISALDIRWVRADSGRLMQVLVNLVTNAIKFTRDAVGERSVTVSVGVSRTPAVEILENPVVAQPLKLTKKRTVDASDEMIYLWFKVRDTGRGMDSAEKARIFTRFSQASPKTYGTYGGSGLGLVVSMKLVTLQGGEVGFTSEKGSGSTFAFYVEASKMALPENSLLSTEVDGAPPTPIEPPRGSKAPKMTILLVEDNLINQKVLKKQLIRAGFAVYTADNGQHAFDFMKTTQHHTYLNTSDADSPVIDVILMDVEMPVMDGLDCTRQIRAAEHDGVFNRRVPIIAVTANARAEQLKQATEVGMDEAISKPFHLKELIDLFRSLGLLRKDT